MTQNALEEDQEQRFKDFVEQFLCDNDRASVIIGTARLDYQLYELLTHVLLPNACSADQLLGTDGPVGTFRARIDLAHRLGLIKPDLARALHLIRKIRNDFAHEASSAALNAGSIQDRVRELVRPFVKDPVFVWSKKVWKESPKIYSRFEGTRADFRIALALIYVRLQIGSEQQQRLTAEHAISLFS